MAPLNGTSTTAGVAGVTGSCTKFDGVLGITTADGHAGVAGACDSGNSNGVYGRSKSANGVIGFSSGSGVSGVAGVNDDGAGSGVYGRSGHGNGVYGESKALDGILGITTADGHAGIAGVCDSGASNGVYGRSNVGVGVWGTSMSGEGVHGETNAKTWVASVGGFAREGGIGPGVMGQSIGLGPGVFGSAINDAGVVGYHGNPHLEETLARQDGVTAGVFGASDVGAGVAGYSRSGLAGKFDGSVQVTGNLTVNGDVFIPGADCAEQFEIVEAETVEAGSVVVIDENGSLRRSEYPYDTKVAGVVSGAGSFRPGIVLDGRDRSGDRRPIALVGKVYCMVDAQYSPITIGDLLTTSPTSGHAMKATDPARAFGAVLGKALGTLASGKGLLPILVTLQ